MIYRKAPKCDKCGQSIRAIHHKTQVPFCGDNFSGWDYKGHICRLGIKYFIERMDTHFWWCSGWTNDPMAAKIWNTKEEAEKYLSESFDIPPRLNCQVTEHEFISTIVPPSTSLIKELNK